MSISSEINRIAQNVSDSLTAVASKGATVPSGANSDDLPDLISSLPSTNSVTYNLTGGASASVNPSKVVAGQGFSLKLTAPTGYNLNNVTVTMGGVDITSQVFTPDTDGGGGGANLQTKSVSYTPTTSAQSAQVTADSGYDGLQQVNVSVGAIPSEYIIPTGTKSITANGTGIDVAQYASVDVAVPTGGTTKNIQVYSGYDETNSNTYVATDVSITVSKSGSYKCSWTGLRNTTSGTSGSQLYKNGSAVGSVHASGWIRSYGQDCEETLTLAAGDILTVYARARASNYYMVVGNLIIQEQ